MLETIDKMLESASGFLGGYVLIFALLGTHLYLTFLLRVPQRHFLTGLRLYFGGKGEGQISQFSSLMVSLAANVGTGNIVGVAVAVTSGGPGAVFWCMLTGVLGMATRYAESLLAIRYRVETSTDGINWSLAAEGEFGNLRANPVEQVISFTPRKARHIRFFSTAALDGTGSSVAEFKVYGK